MAVRRTTSIPGRGAGLRLLIHVLALLISLLPPGRAFQIEQQNGWNRLRRPCLLGSSTSFDDRFDDTVRSSSVDFSMDPQSHEAKSITSRLGLSPSQHDKLAELASLVVEWNERINLVSRRDCTEEVIFGRHILPSVALMGITSNPFESARKVVDVGTGGGFPGLPLAIVYPDLDFLLVDSVGKKLKAVEGMVDDLGLMNVRVHHGRAEEMTDDILEGPRREGAYDICLGRSVAALPKFCFWISELIRPASTEDAGDEGGRLVYIIGGDIDETLLSRTSTDVAIDEILEEDGASDKRILVFSQEDVSIIAAGSGEVKQKRGTPRLKSKPKRTQKPKGSWARRDSSVPKQRGYENFKRYNG